MWEQGNNPQGRYEDVNAKMRALEGELTDQEAQATLAEFLYANPGLMLSMLADIELKEMQEIVLKGWMRCDYSMAVWGRGSSKSFLCAIFCLVWALFNPNNRIVIISFAFRASRRILEQIEKFVNNKDAPMLKNCFPKDLQRKTDEWTWLLPNGATIKCLPLGDGVKLRSTRADTIVIDERNYVNANIINEVVLPFLASSNNVKEQIRINKQEDDLVARGEMTEEQRTKLAENVKVIHLSSAGYQFEDMFVQYTKWIENIRASNRKDNSSYFVSRISYEGLPEGLLNEKTIAEAKGSSSESSFNREYRAIFTSDSDGMFSAKKMLDCTVPDGQAPTLEIIGEKGAQYVLGIDPSMSSSKTSDHFAMCLMKLVEKSDGKKIGMVVHSYAVAGGNLKDHILYFLYLLTHFNIVYIAIDSSQGDSVEFINSSNQSKLFKDNNIELFDIDADFKRDNYHEVPKEVKRSYNFVTRRILQKQPFGSVFQKAANDYLMACIEHKNIMFAGKLAANSDKATAAISNAESVLHTVKHHEEFATTSSTEFIEEQDYLIDLTKRECSLIEVSSTILGTLQYALPQNLRRSTSPDRTRKDSYSALLLCNWAVRIYLESQDVHVEIGTPDFPYAWAGVG